MKYVFTFLLCMLFATGNHAQLTVNEKYERADSLLQAGNMQEAYDLFKEISPLINPKDTLYNYVAWYYTTAASAMESKFRIKENFSKSLEYGLEALALIRKYKERFDARFSEREQWMIKNIIVSYHGLGKLEDAKPFRALLYEGYRNKTLPKGIDQYFNFDFFVLDDKNVWGYEWFEELPKDRFSKSFTKIVYYVYSRKPDGTDNEQLYRLHVLMFHKIDEKSPDYVLTLKRTVGQSESSRTLYDYFYTADIDYVKLKADIKTVVKTVNLTDAVKTPGN
ncbi:MAG: hypothetical protein NTW29_08770 [Bacteroidetes bacterium]|nr:hypothetical protein [Bacteroidota bacterium]